MTNEDESLWIVLNGEIYNFQSCGDGSKAATPSSRQSDTEVILHLYEEKGERCVDELDGMFAFALWDARRAACCSRATAPARSRSTPTRRAASFAFASEPKALLAPSRRAARADEAASRTTSASATRPRPAPSTGRSRSSRRPHAVVIEAGAEPPRRYWRPAFGRRPAGAAGAAVRAGVARGGPRALGVHRRGGEAPDRGRARGRVPLGRHRLERRWSA